METTPTRPTLLVGADTDQRRNQSEFDKITRAAAKAKSPSELARLQDRFKATVRASTTLRTFLSQPTVQEGVRPHADRAYAAFLRARARITLPTPTPRAHCTPNSGMIARAPHVAARRAATAESSGGDDGPSGDGDSDPPALAALAAPPLPDSLVLHRVPETGAAGRPAPDPSYEQALDALIECLADVWIAEEGRR